MEAEAKLAELEGRLTLVLLEIKALKDLAAKLTRELAMDSTRWLVADTLMQGAQNLLSQVRCSLPGEPIAEVPRG